MSTTIGTPTRLLLQRCVSISTVVTLLLTYHHDGASQTVNSLLTLETNSEHKVVRHTEEWNHHRETTSEDGFLGMLNEHRKKITATVTGMFISQEPPVKN